MSVKIAVICFKSKTLANGEHPLMLRITEGKKRTTKSLGISINPKYWDFKKEEPKAKQDTEIIGKQIVLMLCPSGWTAPVHGDVRTG